MLQQPQCWNRQCRHFQGISQPGDDESLEHFVCKAFPNGIPDDIAFGDNPHTKPVEGDNGIQYEKGPYDAMQTDDEDEDDGTEEE